MKKLILILVLSAAAAQAATNPKPAPTPRIAVDTWDLFPEFRPKARMYFVFLRSWLLP